MKKIISTLQGNLNHIPPIWLMRQAGRYLPEYLSTRAEAGDFLNLCYNSKLAAEVTMQPLRRFNFDAAILFSDILVVPHALGQDVRFEANHGPLLGEIPPLINFNTEKFHHHLEPVYQTIENIRDQMAIEGFESSALIGFSGAPWTLACYMIDKKGSKDFALTRIKAMQDESEFQRIINVLIASISAYLIKQIDHGVEIVQIFDSWAGVLSPTQFQKWVVSPTKEIVQNIRSKYPNVPIIGFPKGSGILYLDYVRLTGITAIGFDHHIPALWIKDNIQSSMPIQGNLDPYALIGGGQYMFSEIDTILDCFKDRPYVFNLGHGIDKSTPPDNVKQMVEYVRGKVV